MFEIMASGSVMFTDAGDEYGLKQLFPDDSYVTYNKLTYEDTKEKAEKILNNPDFRNQLTTKALKCIKEKHTHEIRAQELITIIRERINKKSRTPSEGMGLLQKITNFFNKPNSIVITPKETLSQPNPTENPITNPIPQPVNFNSESENLKIIKKLLFNNIKVCLLTDTCYNMVLHNKLGLSLSIAVDDVEKAKKIVNDSFILKPFPKDTKKFIFDEEVLYIPYPILPYLKKECGNDIVNDLKSKEKSLRLIGEEYKYCKRSSKLRRKR